MVRMRTWDELHPGVKKILKRQCKAVGVDYRTVDFSRDGWYREHQWPEAVELAFQKKLAEDLMKDKAMREGIMERPVRDAKRCRQVAAEFTFTYGWTYPQKETACQQNQQR